MNASKLVDVSLKNDIAVADVCAVVVTFNRLSKLKKALASYSVQTLPPKYLVVVDNASSDGTNEFLQNWKKQDAVFKKIVITTEENLGGSGGFYFGQKKALDLDANWIMLADDDAYLDPEYLQGMQNYIKTHDAELTSIVCGKVLEQGKCVNIHRTYLKCKWNRNFQAFIPSTFYNQESFEPDFVSYVGVLINKQKLKTAGLVNKNYFIWYDDTEHSYRLSKLGKIVCLPAFSIVHDIMDDNQNLSWKNYYGYRNNIDFFKKHFPLQCPIVVLILFFKTLLSPLHGKSFVEMKLRFIAIKNGLIGKLGKHSYYKPGWKP